MYWLHILKFNLFFRLFLSRYSRLFYQKDIFELPGTIFTAFLLGINFFLFQAICTEAGLLALRERRMKVTHEDFKKAKDNVLYRKSEGTPEGLYL